MAPIEELRILDEWLETVWSDPSAAVARYPLHRSIWTPHLRLGIAMRDHCAGRAPQLGEADFVTLVRAVLRYHAVHGNVTTGVLSVPCAVSERASVKAWSAASVDVDLDRGRARLRARPWRPSWLPGAEKLSPDDGLYDHTPRRNDPTVPGDPILGLLGLQTYRSVAQREAVRTVLCAAAGSTVTVDLPTGSGKSLCAFVPALINGLRGDLPLGVTPIAIPTTALKLDLERKLRELVGHPVAYSVEDRSEAEETRRRIASGQQGPLLASPESLVGSLREPLCKAAAAGHIRHFVIDEAHMVTAWGDEFRPAFQQLPGLRRELLRRAKDKPLVTVLMSATFTEYTLRAVEELFPAVAPGEFRIVHAVRLRPEPAYWSVRAPGDTEREQWILESLRHLPRPLILYALKRAEVAKWRGLLQVNGFNRVEMIRGDSDDQHRRQVLKSWNENRLDIVVATSAFGLGVDKPDVRAVVHASLPEGLDRLYQDVGRGGRDGYASLSLVVWCSPDWKSAASVAAPKFIGAERGRQRWRAMFFDRRKERLGDDQYVLRVTVRPGAATRDIDMENEENEKWNRRTLTLMARAGLLELQGGVSGGDESGAASEMTVRLLKGQLDRAELWEITVEDRRKELARSYRQNIDRLAEALSGERCIAHVLQDCYSSERYDVKVVRACGGCAFCRANRKPRLAGPLRAGHTPHQPPPSRVLVSPVAAWFGAARMRFIYYPPAIPLQDVQGRLGSLFHWLVEGGIGNWVVDREMASGFGRGPWAVTPGQPVFVYDQLPNDIARTQPTAVVVQWDEALWQSVWSAVGPEGRSGRQGELPGALVVVLPQDIRAPDRRDRVVSQILQGTTLVAWEEEFVV